MTHVPPLSRQEFRSRFENLLSRLPAADVAETTWIDLPSDRKPWLDTGVDLAAGEALTAFAMGRTRLKGTDLSFGAAFQVWYRIGTEGTVFRGTRSSHSFSADAPGRLFLASYFPGEWSTRTGGLATPDSAYTQVEGVHTVALVRWRNDPLYGLTRLVALGDVAGLVAGEIDRLTHPVPIPSGWHYLWFLGPAEVYRPCAEPGRTPAICCHSHDDAGLLQKDVDLPFKPATRLRWTWRIDVLPSAVGEDTLPTHDYLSIAVEFDNGQDITYFWSAELPVGRGFRCPIPTWTARETHVVVRTGSEGLGEWFDEERDLYRDYQDYIGGPIPARIVRVWLIAVSLFQGREGRCRYSDISLASEDGVLRVA